MSLDKKRGIEKLPSDPYGTINLFTRYIIYKQDKEIDVSRILSTKCYDEWYKSRKTNPKRPPHAFRKAVTGHCTIFKVYFIKF